MEIPHPGPAPRPDLEPTKSAASRPARFVLRRLNHSAIVGLVVASLALLGGLIHAYIFMLWLVCAVVGIVTHALMHPHGQMNHALSQAEKTWHTVLDRWNNECSGAKFDEVLADLKQARLELTLLVKRRKTEVERAIAQATQEPLRKYLSAFPIQQLPVNDLTRSQRMKLADYGIRTAADVDRDQSIIPSLVSKKAARELLAWYRMHVRGFQPTPPHPAQIAAIERRFDYHEQRLATKLIEGRERLQHSREQIIDSRRRLEGPLARAWKDLRRAQQQTQ